jgi:hypothetical protein
MERSRSRAGRGERCALWAGSVELIHQRPLASLAAASSSLPSSSAGLRSWTRAVMPQARLGGRRSGPGTRATAARSACRALRNGRCSRSLICWASLRFSSWRLSFSVRRQPANLSAQVAGLERHVELLVRRKSRVRFPKAAPGPRRVQDPCQPHAWDQHLGSGLPPSSLALGGRGFQNALAEGRDIIRFIRRAVL